MPVPESRLTDSGAERRLGELISQVYAVVHGRGTLSGIGAGLRSWKGTYRSEDGQFVAFLVKNGAIIATALLVIPLIAGSVATLGALPIAAAIGTVAALITKKLLGMALHARDVNAILELVKKGEDEREVKSLKWDEVKPKLGSDAADLKALADMAERIFAKLVGDIAKLDGEIEEAREYGRTHLDKTAMVAFLLKAEAHILEKGYTVEKLPGHRFGRDVYSGIYIRDLSVKSSEIGVTNRALHRLRRIRFYLRWMAEYMRLHEGSAMQTINDASKVEEMVVQACMCQVMVTGNHDKCGGICFGPKEDDIKVTAAPAQTVSARYAHVKPGGFETRNHAVDMPAGLGEAFGNEAWKHNKAEQVKSTVMSSAGSSMVEHLMDQHAKDVIVGKLTEVAGAAVGNWAGGFVGDSISAAMDEAVQRYRVSRPLQQRVKLVREAMRKNDIDSLDKDIAELAGQNDMKAVLQAFLLAHSHYPKRILERTEKLRDALTALRNNGHVKGQSPFASCEEAATTMRYLVKVYHQVEKQAIHVLFVKFALEAMERKIFIEGYKHMMKPVLKDIVAFDRSKLVHVNKTWEVDPLAVQRHVGKMAMFAKAEQEERASRAVAEATRLQAEAARQRQSDVAALQGKLSSVFGQAVQLFGATYLNAAPFALGHFRTVTQPPELASKPLTMDEWRTASNVFLRARSPLTLELDRALEAYLRSLQGVVPGPRGAPVNVTQKASLDKVVRDLNMRAQGLRGGVHAQVERWLNDKSVNPTSARRPAVQQLAVMVETELQDLEGAARACTSLISSGSGFGLFH